MIYFDNAATTWPKPPGVAKAMEECMTLMGANPGRSGHRMALQAGRLIYETRELLAKLFGVDNPLRIVFTLNATEALNQALLGLLKPGDHVISGSQEHNSVSRPLHFLEKQGVEVTKAQADPEQGVDPEAVRRLIRSNTRALVFTHASNVTGMIFPVKQLGALAREAGLNFVVDAAQTAGTYPIDVEEMNIDLLAFPGHKGLYGPQGTGGLYVREGVNITALKYGGTGSKSENPDQPEIYPDYLESGTPNTVGIAGLGAGVRFVLETGTDTIRRHEEVLTGKLIAGLREIPGVIAYGPGSRENQAPVVSFNLGDKDPGQVAFILDQLFDLACRPGLHCAPDAHKAIGTFPQGTIRFSFSYFNTEKEVESALEAVQQIAEEMGIGGR